MHDHALVNGGTLYKAVERAGFCDEAVIDLPQRMDRRAARPISPCASEPSRSSGRSEPA